MKKIVFSLLVLFSIGCESEDNFSAWIDVSKVASDDTLSVRSEPNSSSDKVGSLNFDQKYIQVIGAANVGKSTWLNVQTSTSEGWVNRFYTKEADVKKFDEALKCSGTEPFWSLDIVDGEAVFKDISDEQVRLAASGIVPSKNHNNRWLIQLANSDKTGEVFLASTGACSDDMSDRKYQYELGLTLQNKQFYTGCCNVMSK